MDDSLAQPRSKFRHLLASSGLRWGLCLTYAGLVAYLSLADHPPVPEMVTGFEHWDKVAHFGMYGGMMFFLEWAGALRRLRYPDLTFGAVAALFGLLMEIGQGTLTRTRRFDPWDEVANVAGVLVFIVVYRLFLRHRQPRSGESSVT
ncbi:MAG: hypothetical protein WCH61_11065 [bacterium]